MPFPERQSQERVSVPEEEQAVQGQEEPIDDHVSDTDAL